LFQVPFTAGWSYGRRQGYFQTQGDTEDANRILRAELSGGDGKPLRIPEDLDSQWNAIVFAKPAPWSSKRDDGLPPSPKRLLKSFSDFAASRPAGDVKVRLVLLGGDVESARAGLEDAKTTKKSKNDKDPVECPILTLPGGMDSPLVHRLGMLAEDSDFNTVLVNKDGRIAVVMSGLSSQAAKGGASTLINVIEREDEKSISATLGHGEVEAAKARIFALAPPFDPAAVDDRGRKPVPPKYSNAHLRARARVYMALKQWDKALSDAGEVVQRQLGTDGGMSMRTTELDESEALRDSIIERMKPE